MLGYTGTLTSSNQLAPFAGTTVSVSGTAYDGVNNTITAVFSNSQTGTPTLDTCLNGTVSNISPIGDGITFTFTWNPTTISATSFNFDGVLGYTGTLTSSNQLTPLSGTTVSVSITGNDYDGVNNMVTATFSNSQSPTPTLGICLNGTVSGISGSGTTYTFTWNPSTTNATNFNFNNVTGYTGTLPSTNQLTPLAGTTVFISGTGYDNYSNTITATFNNLQTGIPTLGSCTNGTVSGISGSGTTFTFTWIPTTLSATSFNFTNVIGYTGTLTSTNQLTPLAATTVSVSGTGYDNYNSTITATFSNSQSSTPSLGSCTNGTVSNISGTGTTFTFTWNPSSLSAIYFNFTNVIGYTGTLTSSNQLTPVSSTTVSVSVTGSAYDNYNNTITAVFSNSQSSTPTLGSCLNGVVSNITGSGTTYTFTWNPTTTSATSFNFTSVIGYTGTLTSSNQLTPIASTAVSVSITGNAYDGVDNTITAIFSNSQSSTPTLGTCLNGTVSNIAGSGTTYTFTWNPSTTSATSFNFTSVIGYTGTLTSTNQLTPLAGTIVSSILPTSGIYINIQAAMTVTFNNSLLALPTIIPPSGNGTVTGGAYLGTQVTFNWTPTTAGTFTFQFSSVTGTSSTLTSQSITVSPDTTLSPLSVTSCYNGIQIGISAVFSNTLTALPTISVPEGTVSGASYSGNTVTFNWISRHQ